jgi:COPII coat assembly protein SEC16
MLGKFKTVLCRIFNSCSFVCSYLLAPQTSPVAGFAHQSARIALLGSRSPQATHNFTSDPDPIILSEILEFALSLTPTAKGQEPFGGLAHLQPYRFIRAVHLAEVGDISLANR